MITRGCGKPCGLHSSLHVKMQYVAANIIVMLKMKPTEYGCKLQGFPTARQFAISRSDVVCL
jgi:hypothetical protein